MVLPKIITLSGIDGSGKSTLAGLLKKYLEQKDLRVRIAHIGTTFGGSSQPLRPISKIFGVFIFFKDYLQIAFQYLRSIGNYDVVIFDRFVYDTLVKIAYKQNSTHIPKFYILPLHHMAFLLLLPNTTSYKRDQKHSKKYHVKKHELYKEVAQYFSLIQIDATQTAKEIFEEIKRYV